MFSGVSRVTRVPGGNGSVMGLLLLRKGPQVSPPSNLIELGEFVMGRWPSSSSNPGGC